MKSTRLLTIVTIISGVFLFYVWGKVDVVRVGYELEELSKRKAVLEQEHDLLQLKLSQLTAPDRIAAEAAKKLGMKTPDPGQVVLIAVESFPRKMKEKKRGEQLRLAGMMLDQR